MMKRKKSITFQYFQVLLQKEQKDRYGQTIWKTQGRFDLSSWLLEQQVDKNITKNVTVNNDFQANLETIAQSKDNKDIFFARFYKLRDSVPAKVKDGVGAQDIELDEDEYIGEDVSLLYDNSTGVCMLQRNRFSLSYIKISDWISLSCDEGYRVKLKPISDNNILDKVTNKNIRCFDISFANLGNEIEESHNPSLNQIIKSVKYYDGVNASVKISVGRERHRRLDKSSVSMLIQQLLQNKNKLSKAKITISDENDTNIEVLDLFDAIMADRIEVEISDKETLNFRFITKKMEESYERKKEELNEIKLL